jgi:methionine-rich copper-binding protein CopC
MTIHLGGENRRASQTRRLFDGTPGVLAKRALLALTFAGLLTGAFSAPVSAHAVVTSSSPAPNAVLTEGPARLTLTFNSALASSGNAVNVLHSDGTSIGSLSPRSDGAATPTETVDLPHLLPDIYTVAWTSVSGEDGHTLKQFFSFLIGSAPNPVDAPAISTLTAGDTRVNLKIARGNVGPTTLDATLTDANGKALGNLQRVIYRYKPAGLDTDPVDLVAPASGSTARTPSVILGLAGDWDFTVIVRRVGLDDVSAMTTIKLAGMSQPTATTVATTAPSPTSSQLPSPTAVPPTNTAAPLPSPTAAATAVPTNSVVPTATITAATPPAAPASSADSTPPIATIGGVIVLAAVAGVVVTRLRRR